MTEKVELPLVRSSSNGKDGTSRAKLYIEPPELFTEREPAVFTPGFVKRLKGNAKLAWERCIQKNGGPVVRRIYGV